MAIAGGETVTITRYTAGAVDAHGNPTRTSTNITVKGVLVGIGGSNEPILPAANSVDSTLNLYFAPGTTIYEDDVFTVRGSQWVKDGSPADWRAPWNSQFGGVVVPVRRRNG